jgi:hypothetical protein
MTASLVSELRDLSGLLKEDLITDVEYLDLKRAALMRFKQGDGSGVLSSEPPSVNQAPTAFCHDQYIRHGQYHYMLLCPRQPVRTSPAFCVQKFILFEGSSNSKAGTASSQSSLHRYFGPATITSKISGKTYMSPNCPLIVPDNLTCSQCERRCQTKQALLQHLRTHARKGTGL